MIKANAEPILFSIKIRSTIGALLKVSSSTRWGGKLLLAFYIPTSLRADEVFSPQPEEKMKLLRLMAICGFLLISASSCDLLHFDDIQDEQSAPVEPDQTPCKGDCG